jgi:SAM-dependent methyltransferase
MANNKFEKIIKRKYPGYKFSWEIYTDLILERVAHKPYWLDLGAGANIWVREQPGAEFAVGLDLERQAGVKTGGNEAYCVADCEKLPFKPESFNLVTCRYLFEHLKSPETVLLEIERTLASDGILIIQTTNKLNPLVVLSAIVPFSLKRRIFGAIFGEIPAGLFKTYYRFNTASKFEKRLHGLKLEELCYQEDILRQNAAFFAISFGLYRLLKSAGLAKFRGNIVAIYRKNQES